MDGRKGAILDDDAFERRTTASEPQVGFTAIDPRNVIGRDHFARSGTASLKHLLFNALYIISSHDAVSTATLRLWSWLLVAFDLADGLQVATPPSVGWARPSLFSYTMSFGNVDIATFVSVVLVLAATFGSGAHVIWTTYMSRTPPIAILRTFRFMSRLTVTVGFSPITKALANAMVWAASGAGIGSIVVGTLAATLLLAFVPFVCIASAALIDTSPISSDVLASDNGVVIAFHIGLKMLLIVSTFLQANTARSDAGGIWFAFHWLLIPTIACAALVYLVWTMSFHDRAMNFVFGSYFACLALVTHAPFWFWALNTDPSTLATVIILSSCFTTSCVAACGSVLYRESRVVAILDKVKKSPLYGQLMKTPVSDVCLSASNGSLSTRGTSQEASTPFSPTMLSPLDEPSTVRVPPITPSTDTDPSPGDYDGVDPSDESREIIGGEAKEEGTFAKSRVFSSDSPIAAVDRVVSKECLPPGRVGDIAQRVTHTRMPYTPVLLPVENPTFTARHTVFEGRSTLDIVLAIRTYLRSMSSRHKSGIRSIRNQNTATAIKTSLLLFSEAMQEGELDPHFMTEIRIQLARFLMHYTKNVDTAASLLTMLEAPLTPFQEFRVFVQLRGVQHAHRTGASRFSLMDVVHNGKLFESATEAHMTFLNSTIRFWSRVKDANMSHLTSTLVTAIDARRTAHKRYIELLTRFPHSRPLRALFASFYHTAFNSATFDHLLHSSRGEDEDTMGATTHSGMDHIIHSTTQSGRHDITSRFKPKVARFPYLKVVIACLAALCLTVALVSSSVSASTLGSGDVVIDNIILSKEVVYVMLSGFVHTLAGLDGAAANTLSHVSSLFDSRGTQLSSEWNAEVYLDGLSMEVHSAVLHVANEMGTDIHFVGRNLFFPLTQAVRVVERSLAVELSSTASTDARLAIVLSTVASCVLVFVVLFAMHLVLVSSFNHVASTLRAMRPQSVIDMLAAVSQRRAAASVDIERAREFMHMWAWAKHPREDSAETPFTDKSGRSIAIRDETKAPRPEGLTIECTETGVVTFASESLTTVLAWEPEEVIGKNISIFMPPLIARTHGHLMRNPFRKWRSGATRIIAAVRPDGTMCTIQIKMARLGEGRYGAYFNPVPYASIGSSSPSTTTSCGESKESGSTVVEVEPVIEMPSISRFKPVGKVFQLSTFLGALWTCLFILTCLSPVFIIDSLSVQRDTFIDVIQLNTDMVSSMQAAHSMCSGAQFGVHVNVQQRTISRWTNITNARRSDLVATGGIGSSVEDLDLNNNILNFIRDINEIDCVDHAAWNATFNSFETVIVQGSRLQDGMLRDFESLWDRSSTFLSINLVGIFLVGILSVILAVAIVRRFKRLNSVHTMLLHTVPPFIVAADPSLSAQLTESGHMWADKNKVM